MYQFSVGVGEPPGLVNHLDSTLIESPAQVSHGIAAAEEADVPANAWGLVGFMAQKGALLETKPKTSQNPR